MSVISEDSDILVCLQEGLKDVVVLLRPRPQGVFFLHKKVELPSGHTFQLICESTIDEHRRKQYCMLHIRTGRLGLLAFVATLNDPTRLQAPSCSSVSVDLPSAIHCNDSLKRPQLWYQQLWFKVHESARISGSRFNKHQSKNCPLKMGSMMKRATTNLEIDLGLHHQRKKRVMATTRSYRELMEILPGSLSRPKMINRTLCEYMANISLLFLGEPPCSTS